MNDGEPLKLTSDLTCPECGYVAVETMPTDACIYFYDCRKCGALLRPKNGDCCVFCSYGSVPCPPMQSGDCSHHMRTSHGMLNL